MQSAKAPIISAFGADIPAVGYGTMLYPEPEQAVELIVHSLECNHLKLSHKR